MKKRALSILLSLAMCASLLPTAALATYCETCTDEDHDHYCDVCGTVTYELDENQTCSVDGCEAKETNVTGDYTALTYRSEDGETVADGTVELSTVVYDLDKYLAGEPFDPAEGTVTLFWVDEDGTIYDDFTQADLELTDGKATASLTGLPIDLLHHGQLTYTPADPAECLPSENGMALEYQDNAYTLDVDSSAEITINGVSEYRLHFLAGSQITVEVAGDAEGECVWNFDAEYAVPEYEVNGRAVAFAMPEGDVSLTAEWTCSVCADNNDDHYCDLCQSRVSDCTDDTDGDHYCDLCYEHMAQLCVDDDSDHGCDVCYTYMEWLCADEDGNHACDVCAQTLVWLCSDEDSDHYCDLADCGSRLSDCEDWDDDTICDICGGALYPHAGDLGVDAEAGDGTITLTWTAVTEMVGEDALASYTVYCVDEETGDYDNALEMVFTPAESPFTYTFTGLTNDVSYDVGVRAVYTLTQEGYDDPFSLDASTSAIPVSASAVVPGAPEIKNITCGDGSITLEWAAPADNGGASIRSYEIEVGCEDTIYSIGFAPDEPENGEPLSYTVEDLINGKTYTVKLQAVNAKGVGESAETVVTIPLIPYEIVVGRVPVTAENAADVFGDGTVSFDMETLTLTLNGANITDGFSYDEGGMAGIYSGGNLTIELVGANSVTAPDAANGSCGIYVDGELVILGEGSLAATGGAVSGDGEYIESIGIYASDLLSISQAAITAVGGTASACETGEATSTGLSSSGGLGLDSGAVVNATAGDATGFTANSIGVQVSPADENADPISVTLYDSALIIRCGTAKGPDYAQSQGLCVQYGDIYLDEDSTLDTSGGIAEGSYAYASGVEVYGGENSYSNFNIYDSSLFSAGGTSISLVDSDSSGAYLDNCGLYVYGNTSYVSLTGSDATTTSEDEADEPTAFSNGLFVLGGDVNIEGGTIQIAGGSWSGLDGDGIGLYVESEEIDEDGDIRYSGGYVTISCQELTPNPNRPGFAGTKVTITASDDGEAIFAEMGLDVGEKLTVSTPAEAVISPVWEEEPSAEEWVRPDHYTVTDGEGAAASAVTVEPLVYRVSIRGLSYSRLALVPAGQSLNEVYCPFLGIEDFSEALDATKDGYTFGGWYTDESCTDGNEYTGFDTPVTEDITLYAKWVADASADTGSSGPATYKPVVKDAENGKITVSPKRPERGDKVTVTLIPDAGYEVTGLIITDRKGNAVEVTDNGDGTCTFTQPSGKVTISATFAMAETVVVSFTDLENNVWYLDAVDYVVSKGLMNGVSGSEFAPYGVMNRAMIVTILWRLEDSPVVNYAMNFADVSADSWYGEAVRWAAAEGIVTGRSDTAFAPWDSVTREQFAAILWRYAKYKGMDVSVGENTNILSYDDAFDISEYAIPAMQWACGAGIITGKSEGTLAPADAVIRAEAAQMLMRFLAD